MTAFGDPQGWAPTDVAIAGDSVILHPDATLADGKRVEPLGE